MLLLIFLSNNCSHCEHKTSKILTNLTDPKRLRCSVHAGKNQAIFALCIGLLNRFRKNLMNSCFSLTEIEHYRFEEFSSK